MRVKISGFTDYRFSQVESQLETSMRDRGVILGLPNLSPNASFYDDAFAIRKARGHQTSIEYRRWFLDEIALALQQSHDKMPLEKFIELFNDPSKFRELIIFDQKYKTGTSCYAELYFNPSSFSHFNFDNQVTSLRLHLEDYFDLNPDTLTDNKVLIRTDKLKEVVDKRGLSNEEIIRLFIGYFLD